MNQLLEKYNIQSNNSIFKFFLYLAIFLMFSMILYYGKTVIMSFTISIFLYILVEPIIKILKKIKIPVIVIDLIVILLIIGIVSIFSFLLYASVNTFFHSFGKYENKFYKLIVGISKILAQYGINIEINGIYKNIYLWSTSILSKYAILVTNGFTKIIGKFMLIIIFLFFFILDSDNTLGRFKRGLDEHALKSSLNILDYVKKSIAKYVWIKFIMSVSTAVVIFLCFHFLKPISFNLIWAMLVFLMNWIPSIGSIAITFLLILFGFVEYFPNYTDILIISLIAGLPQIIIGSIIDPLVTGDNVNLSPVIVMISLLYWGMIWGVMGMFLSVPLTVAIKSFLENTKDFKSLSILMGN